MIISISQSQKKERKKKKKQSPLLPTTARVTETSLRATQHWWLSTTGQLLCWYLSVSSVCLTVFIPWASIHAPRTLFSLMNGMTVTGPYSLSSPSSLLMYSDGEKRALCPLRGTFVAAASVPLSHPQSRGRRRESFHPSQMHLPAARGSSSRWIP